MTGKPAPALTRTAATAAVAAATESIDHLRDAGPPRLIRLGETAVFHLSGEWIARVMRPAADLADVARAVQVSQWLNDNGIAAAEALDVGQPVPAAGLLVTFWRTTGDSDRYGTTSDLARLLRSLHELSTPTELELPEFDPFGRADRRLATAPIAEADRALLGARLAELRAQVEGLEFVLPRGMIHGDANVGNVLVDGEGRPRLIDLDGVCVGPREWDLILTAMYFDRYGWHTAEEYHEFVEAYGFDVMAWDGYEMLADLRETLMLTWMAQNVARDERTAAEFAKRMRAVRENGSRRDWQPF